MRVKLSVEMKSKYLLSLSSVTFSLHLAYTIQWKHYFGHHLG